MKNDIDYNLYYPTYRIGFVGNWLNDWIKLTNLDVATNFRYKSESIILNYKLLYTRQFKFVTLYQ